MMRRNSIVVAFVACLLAIGQSVEAQFLKKLIKKSSTTTVVSSKADNIDDDVQTPLADITTLTDNSNNRNAFLGIPLGIKADCFERQLLALGFTERKYEGPQTAKSYVYEGDVYGVQCQVSLIISEQTARVYAVDVEDETTHTSIQDISARYEAWKAALSKTYGIGFVDNGGEAYTIPTRLGTVHLHYERGTLANSYTLGLTIDDAKAYAMAYAEMDEADRDVPPRVIENGLAQPCNHTDLVGLAYQLAQARTFARAQAVLRSYDYTLRRPNARPLTATFTLGDYVSTVTLLLRKQVVTTITIVATDDADAVRRDLQIYGFTASAQTTYKQGKTSIQLSEDKQGRVVMTIK